MRMSVVNKVKHSKRSKTSTATDVHVANTPYPQRPTSLFFSFLSLFNNGEDVTVMWQDTSSPYGAHQNAYYNAHASGSGAPTVGAQHGTPLQFYAPSPGPSENGYYPGARPSLEGNMGSGGVVGGSGVSYGGNIQQVGPWWTAFGTGGLEGEPPLLEGAFLHDLPLL